VCLAPTHVAYNQPYDGNPVRTSYLWSINVQMMPGRFKYYEQSSAATGGAINFDRTCAANSFCILERARPVTYWADTILTSDFYTWVQVGPTDSAACAVTAYQTSPAIRTGGCFTGQTPILMANGKEKLISEIRENDHVLNPHYGMGVRVRKVVKGPEKKSLYAVMLGQKQIEVTEDHPFFTQRGWVQTLDLKPGDQLFGKGHGQVITKVMRLPYQQPVDVWNFELDTEDPMAHVVVANGIPTGDLVTQLELKKNKKPLP
ncbi:MAG: Hint domain-containing protein, partial [Deltaproteobacteria bacterium]